MSGQDYRPDTPYRENRDRKARNDEPATFRVSNVSGSFEKHVPATFRGTIRSGEIVVGAGEPHGHAK